ncbi:MAG: hybrid sensor histidine kinase/response regulator [Anaerolineae bacterium]|nr:hybrid sensor histidine kinase/response regulator [Anaerolineae bacterium]
MAVINEPSASGASILIVDDTPFNLKFLADVLSRAGYITHTATDGQQAVELAQTLHLDLVLLDIMMPGLSGYEVCSHLKADEKTCDIPVIFLSALNQELDKVQAFTVGGVDYITKPFQVKEVLARIETHLTLRHLQKDLEERNLSLQQEIAERQLIEEMLRQQTAELEARNAELDAFAHTVAHDLKTPLTAVVGFSDLLQRRYPQMSADKLGDTLAIIAQNGRRMANIINEMLLLASVRQMDEVPMKSLDMGSIVVAAKERLVDIFREHDVQISSPEVWPTAYGYGPWVEEVWVNYMSNAVKYGGSPPHIEVGATSESSDMVRFWVRDNGDGLTNEEQSHLFTAFTRLGETPVEGHGLGLSIVQRIITRLEGEVGVESVAGEGSTFFFTLPAVMDNTDDPVAQN